MTGKISRRGFLELSAMGIVVGTASEVVGGQAKGNLGAVEPKAGSGFSIWVTSGTDRFASAPQVPWQARSGSASDVSVVFDPSHKYQDILGFGGAFTDATCYTFNRLTPKAREKLFRELFHPAEMGLSVGRICVGSSDYSTKLYSYDDGEPDPELTRFSIEHDREYIVPMLKEARAVNPDIFLFSSPWSPPGWMKFNGTMLGGSMRRSYLKSYAQYYLKFLQAYAADGVPVQALTSQNEVDTDQDGRMPACIWPQEYEIEFVRDHLGPLLERNNIDTKVWVLDHNYNLWGRAVCTLADSKLRKYCNAVAWHGYYGTPDMMTKVHDIYPEVEMHWTEGGPDYTDSGYLNDWCKWSGKFSDMLTNWCRSITAWNLALDERGRPNIGPFPCGGVVTINSQTAEVTPSGQYWAFMHYSRKVKRGARRFASQSSATDLQHVAFENVDGGKILILTNPGPARTVQVRLGSMAAAVPMNADAVATLTW